MPHYLDYNATAPLRPEVIQAMALALQLPLNASSVHAYGRQAKQMVEDTRRRLAERINCWPQELIWCASASEANNAILNTARTCLTADTARAGVLISAVEHPSILKPAAGAEMMPVGSDSIIALDWLKERLATSPAPLLISVMLANNETGVVQPVRAMVKLAHKHGVLVHVDAVQAVGKLPLDITALGVDYATLAFHKTGGPQGIAALFVANGKPFQPFIIGGGQEYNRRAGTENVAAIAGVQAWLASTDDTANMTQLRTWLDVMEATLTKASPSAVIIGKDALRLPNTSCIIMPHTPQEIQLMHFDLAGIMISAGSACTSGRIEASHVLTAMGYEKALAECAIRISGGWQTREEDIHACTKTWLALAERATR